MTTAILIGLIVWIGAAIAVWHFGKAILSAAVDLLVDTVTGFLDLFRRKPAAPPAYAPPASLMESHTDDVDGFADHFDHSRPAAPASEEPDHDFDADRQKREWHERHEGR